MARPYLAQVVVRKLSHTYVECSRRFKYRANAVRWANTQAAAVAALGDIAIITPSVTFKGD